MLWLAVKHTYRTAGWPVSESIAIIEAWRQYCHCHGAKGPNEQGRQSRRKKQVLQDAAWGLAWMVGGIEYLWWHCLLFSIHIAIPPECDHLVQGLGSRTFFETLHISIP